MFLIPLLHWPWRRIASLLRRWVDWISNSRIVRLVLLAYEVFQRDSYLVTCRRRRYWKHPIWVAWMLQENSERNLFSIEALRAPFWPLSALLQCLQPFELELQEQSPYSVRIRIRLPPSWLVVWWSISESLGCSCKPCSLLSAFPSRS